MPCGLVDAWWLGVVRLGGEGHGEGPSGSRSGGRSVVQVDGSVDVVRGGLELDVAGAGDGVDAGLDGQLVAGLDDGDVPGAQVADGALRMVTTQPKQMPIRHPLGMRTPASSPASRIGVPPSASTVTSLAGR